MLAGGELGRGRPRITSPPITIGAAVVKSPIAATTSPTRIRTSVTGIGAQIGLGASSRRDFSDGIPPCTGPERERPEDELLVALPFPDDVPPAALALGAGAGAPLAAEPPFARRFWDDRRRFLFFG